jgi:hypothetical protein
LNTLVVLNHQHAYHEMCSFALMCLFFMQAYVKCGVVSRKKNV